jgi:hypothetical protein
MLHDYLALDSTGRAFVLEQLFNKNEKTLTKSNLINITTEMSQYESVVEDLEFLVSIYPDNIGRYKLVLSDFTSYRRNCTNTAFRLKRFFRFIESTFDDIILKIDLRTNNLVELRIDSNKCFHNVLVKILSYKSEGKSSQNFKPYTWYFDDMGCNDYTFQLARVLSHYEGSRCFNISHSLVNHHNGMEVSLIYQGYSTYSFEVEFDYIEDALKFISSINPNLDSRWEDTSRRTTQVKVGIEGEYLSQNIDYLIKAL